MKKKYSSPDEYWADKVAPVRKILDAIEQAPPFVSYIFCWVGIALCGLIVAPALKDSVEYFVKFVIPVLSKITM
jgi:hypothetical protein